MKNYQVLETVKPFMEMLNGVPTLTAEENAELIERYINGDKSVKEELTQGNLRLVVKLAIQYGTANNVLDLIQEGSIGLMESIDHYELGKGTAFTTYAYSWIAKYILQYIGNDRLIQLPINLATSLGKVKTAIDKLTETMNSSVPTTEDIAKESNLSVKEVERLLPHLTEMINLNKEVDDGEGQTTQLLDIIEQDTFEQPEDIIETIYEKSLVEELFKALTDTEKQVIMYSYSNKTLDEIGKMLGYTRQNISLIKSKAEDKMREYASTHNLKYA